MGKTINVSSFAEMEKAANTLHTISETYTSISDQLLQRANTMGTAWEGADNLAFVEQINGFTQELKQMAAKLDLASQALRRQKENYVAQQDSNITQVKKLVN